MLNFAMVVLDIVMGEVSFLTIMSARDVAGRTLAAAGLLGNLVLYDWITG